MAQSILYYPGIDIKDGAWLRSALLYWDEINSIVPYRNYPHLSPELLYLESIGQYRPIYPEEIFVLGDIQEFCRSVKRIFGKKKKIFATQKTSSTKRMEIYSPDLTALIHYNKIPDEILKLLTSSGAIHLRTSDGWIEMDYDFAILYMKLLAEFAARSELSDIIIGTSETDKINQIYPRTTGSYSNSVVSISLERCLPIPSSDVSYESLIDFKMNHQAELLELRSKIREFEKSISESTSPTQLKANIAKFKENWQHELYNAEKMFKSQKINLILGSLLTFVSDSGAAASLIQFLKDNEVRHIPMAVLGSAIGMAGLIGVGISRMSYTEKFRASISKNGFAYVLLAKKAGLLNHNHLIETI